DAFAHRGLEAGPLGAQGVLADREKSRDKFTLVIGSKSAHLLLPIRRDECHGGGGNRRAGTVDDRAHDRAGDFLSARRRDDEQNGENELEEAHGNLRKAEWLYVSTP